jgi:hypothetical protein
MAPAVSVLALSNPWLVVSLAGKSSLWCEATSGRNRKLDDDKRGGAGAGGGPPDSAALPAVTRPSAGSLALQKEGGGRGRERIPSSEVSCFAVRDVWSLTSCRDALRANSDTTARLQPCHQRAGTTRLYPPRIFRRIR